VSSEVTGRHLTADTWKEWQLGQFMNSEKENFVMIEARLGKECKMLLSNHTLYEHHTLPWRHKLKLEKASILGAHARNERFRLAGCHHY